MLFVSAAVAAGPGDAFLCPALTEPSEGLWYSDPWSMSPAVYDTLGEWVESQYEGDCPGACDRRSEDCAYAADCVTSTGTRIVVDYTNDYHSSLEMTEGWDVTVESADGTWLTLSSTYDYDSEFGGVASWGFDWTWTASWSGPIDAELPHDASVAVSGYTYEAYGTFDGDLYEREEWDDGICTWTSNQSWTGDDWAEPETSYDIEVGESVLELEPESSCTLTRSGTFNGTSINIDPGTWRPVEDADDDGAPAGVDCDDADSGRSPCFVDPSCDGYDNDCDGADEDDWDADGYVAECAGGRDCDDTDYRTHPGARDDAGDGIDRDCDGVDPSLDPVDSGPFTLDSALPVDSGPPDRAESPDGGCGGGCAFSVFFLLARRGSTSTPRRQAIVPLSPRPLHTASPPGPRRSGTR